MPSGQPMSSWSATAFCPVFGESAARTLLVYRIGPSFCCRPPPKIDSVLNFGGLGQPFRTSRSRQRNEPPPFLLRQRKRILLISLQRTRTRPLYLLITMIFRFLFRS